MINKNKNRKEDKRIDIKKVFKINNLDKKTNYTIFNCIKGIDTNNNIVKNEFGDYIMMIKCLNYSSLKFIINYMSYFYFKEIQIFVYNKKFYASLKFDKVVVDNEIFMETIEELSIRKDEFVVLNIYEILLLLQLKVYRKDLLNRTEYENMLGYKNSLVAIQNSIFAKDVAINDEYVLFNKNTEDGKQVKHQILGLQMYPSILYEGFLTEINYLNNVETTTYIKTINLDKVRRNVKEEENKIIYDYINDLHKLYNTCFYIHIWGNEEEFYYTKKKVFELSNKYHVILNEYFMQQKRAYSAFLPLMNNYIKSYRALSNINGILPFNEDIMKHFKTNMKYGIEEISNKPLYYERKSSGIILSSNRESKRYFIQNERNHVVLDLKLTCKIIDFDLENSESYISYLFKNQNFLNADDMFKIFSMYCFLCLGAYRESNTIEKGEKALLNEVLTNLEKNDKNYNFDSLKEKVFKGIEKNKILTNKLSKYFDNPNKDIIKYINNIFEIFISFIGQNQNYIYIYNIQKIINCLDILAKEIFERKTNNLYLLSSYNDFMLLNNIDVSNIIFDAPYINIIDISANDLQYINNYLNLPNKDLVHLRNKTNITGTLYTDICEFNYFIKRKNSNEHI